MELRSYQACAVRAVDLHYEYSQGNPCVCIPTGGGKTIIAAQLAKDAALGQDGRCLVVSHVKELVEQTARTLAEFDESLDVGIHSAGLRRRDQDQSILVAGIQSVYEIGHALGKFSRVVVDEAHRIPDHDESMYQRLLADLGGAQLVGLTATPYRMSGGPICGPGKLFSKLVHETSVLELTERGLLAPLEYLGAREEIDLQGAETSFGEFAAAVTSEIMRQSGEVDCKQILRECTDRHKILVFCVDVAHAQRTMEVFHKLGEPAEYVVSDTLLRDEIIQDFKDGKIRILVNVGILTHGFDSPGIDCIVLLRPTLSKGLHYQMIGRGLRPFPGKTNCLILDLVGNCVRHGLVGRSKRTDQRMIPATLCTLCKLIYPSVQKHCPSCGEVTPDEEDKWWEVMGVTYTIHEKEGKPDSMRVEYRCAESQTFREWVCFAHGGYAQKKAEEWWAQRSMVPCPAETGLGIGLISQGAVRRTNRIKVEVDGQFDRIVESEFDKVPVVDGKSWNSLVLDFDLEAEHFVISLVEDDVPF